MLALPFAIFILSNRHSWTMTNNIEWKYISCIFANNTKHEDIITLLFETKKQMAPHVYPHHLHHIKLAYFCPLNTN